MVGVSFTAPLVVGTGTDWVEFTSTSKHWMVDAGEASMNFSLFHAVLSSGWMVDYSVAAGGRLRAAILAAALRFDGRSISRRFSVDKRGARRGVHPSAP